MTSAAASASKPLPWLSVWWRPRDTIELVVITDPKYHALLLAVISGVSTILYQGINAGFTTELLDWRLIAIGAIAGAISGVVTLYISAAIFSWSGRILGGHASPA